MASELPKVSSYYVWQHDHICTKYLVGVFPMIDHYELLGLYHNGKSLSAKVPSGIRSNQLVVWLCYEAQVSMRWMPFPANAVRLTCTWRVRRD
jgi:hypothetical protein